MKKWKIAVGTEDLGKTTERIKETEFDRVENISAYSGKVISYQDIPHHIRIKETYQNYRTYYQCPYCGYSCHSDSRELVDREEI
jgi:rubrerythrin